MTRARVLQVVFVLAGCAGFGVICWVFLQAVFFIGIMTRDAPNPCEIQVWNFAVLFGVLVPVTGLPLAGLLAWATRSWWATLGPFVAVFALNAPGFVGPAIACSFEAELPDFAEYVFLTLFFASPLAFLPSFVIGWRRLGHAQVNA